MRAISSKVECHVFYSLADDISKMPTKDEVLKMQKVIYRDLDKFRENNRVFSEGFEAQNICLREFDEVLSSKCNKHSLKAGLIE